MRYLAGQTRILAGSIAFGTGVTAPTVLDSRLTYEFDRATIYLTTPDYINRTIIFKSTIPEGTIGTIYEVGLYSSPYSISNGTPSRLLASFESGYESWSNGTFNAGNQRVGNNALRLAPAASGTLATVLPSVGLDLSSYANTDQFSLAFFNLNTNTSSVKVRLRAAGGAAYYEYTISNPAAGYNVVTFAKSAFTTTGVVDFASIDSIELSVSAKAAGAAQVDFDGLRVDSGPSEDNVLISHSVLPTPVVKAGLKEMDIEYALEVSL